MSEVEEDIINSIFTLMIPWLYMQTIYNFSYNWGSSKEKKEERKIF